LRQVSVSEHDAEVLLMTLTRSLLLFSLAAAWFSVQAQPAEQTIAAISGGASLSAEEFADELARLPPQARAQVLARSASAAQFARGLLLRRELARRAESEGLQNDPKVAAALREARERVLAEAALVRAEGPAPDPAVLERMARNEYDAAPEKFSTPEQIRVSHILISARACEAESRAREVLSKARLPGADFAALAREYSDDRGSAARGGDLGLLSKAKMAPAFEKAAFALKQPGDLSDVVKTELGYHVIRLDQRTPAKRQPFDAVRETIVKNLAQAQVASSRQQTVDRLIASMQINGPALESVLDGQSGQPKSN
jgi:peptidyl-prolyl cis-trans isomerase C